MRLLIVSAAMTLLVSLSACQTAHHKGGSGYAGKGLPGSVRTALSRVKARCPGYRLISTYRRGARIAGTNTRSLHAYGLAADFRVSDYGCALRVLRGVPGIGFSRDGRRCRHLHLSDGRRIGRTEPRGFIHGRC